MKKWVGWVLLAASLYVTYEGWRNSRPQPETQIASRAAACDGREGCAVEGEQPRSIRTDFFGRDYEWKTTKGDVMVQCRRPYVFWGAWSCAPKST